MQAKEDKKREELILSRRKQRGSRRRERKDRERTAPNVASLSRFDEEAVKMVASARTAILSRRDAEERKRKEAVVAEEGEENDEEGAFDELVAGLPSGGVIAPVLTKHKRPRKEKEDVEEEEEVIEESEEENKPEAGGVSNFEAPGPISDLPGYKGDYLLKDVIEDEVLKREEGRNFRKFDVAMDPRDVAGPSSSVCGVEAIFRGGGVLGGVGDGGIDEVMEGVRGMEDVFGVLKVGSKKDAGKKRRREESELRDVNVVWKWREWGLRPILWKAFRKASGLDTVPPLVPFLWAHLIRHRDVMFTLRSWENDTAIRATVALHVANHLVNAYEAVSRTEGRIRARRVEAISKAANLEEVEAEEEPAEKDDDEEEDEEDDEENDRDQGFSKARVLVLLPFRWMAMRFIRQLHALLPGAKKVVHLADKFYDRFGDEDAPKGAPEHPGTRQCAKDWKGMHIRSNRRESQPVMVAPEQERGGRVIPATYAPRDHAETYRGNVDDDFKFGMEVKRYSVRMMTPFEFSDIIVASPLGLGRTIKDPDTIKALASIEMVVVDHAGTILLQNVEHLRNVLQALNRTPSDPSGVDFARVRQVDLAGQLSKLRQTIILSDREEPELSAIARASFSSIHGAVLVRGVFRGVLPRVPLSKLRMIFQRIPTTKSLAKRGDARFIFFRDVVLARLQAAAPPGADFQKYTLIYVPSYLDFVRIRNHCTRGGRDPEDAAALADAGRAPEALDMAYISEYSPDKDANRARNMLREGTVPLVLYTERWHALNRRPIRGAQHLILYGPPHRPDFFLEQIETLRFAHTNGRPLSVLCLFDKYDHLALARIVGNQEADRMCDPDEKPTSVFLS